MSAADRSFPERIGRYQIVRLIGCGAMGRVLLAHDPQLDRDVAVKHLRDDLALLTEQRQALSERMRQEARASARVSHPNVIALHDMGEDPSLGLFLVFEYVDGPSLQQRLERGALSALEVARLACELGGALDMTHEAGVLHRDIKPENIMLSKTGAKISDFGIARVPDSTLTNRGGLLGTPAYSAPEAITSGKFSSTSDQFSLAATLYEALSGRRAFPGDDAVAVAAKIATDEPPKIADVCRVDASVDTVLARGLSKNPKARYESCQAFGQALATALGQPYRESLGSGLASVFTPHPQIATATANRAAGIAAPPGGALREESVPRMARIALGATVLAGIVIAALVLGTGKAGESDADRPLPAPLLEAQTLTLEASREPARIPTSANQVSASAAAPTAEAKAVRPQTGALEEASQLEEPSQAVPEASATAEPGAEQPLPAERVSPSPASAKDAAPTGAEPDAPAATPAPATLPRTVAPVAPSLPTRAPTEEPSLEP